MRCPTCRATQEWSNECRRCRCDLTLLWEANQAADDLRRRCLWELNAGSPGRALAFARSYDALTANADSRELLAVCALLAGDWPTAQLTAVSLE